MAQTIRPRTKLTVPQAQQPRTPQFGGQPAPSAGTPQAANWMQAPVSSVQSPVVRDPNAMAFLPRAPMSSSTALRSQLGYQTDQYGRQYQMTPQIAGTAMPQGGAGGWMQGQGLGGAPHGVYVQSNLPSPAAGMAPEQKTAFLAQRGWQLGGDGQIVNHPGVMGRIRPDGGLSLVGQPATASQVSAGSQRYQDLKARRQQMADQRIVARARMRGLGQNTPAVRAAMQRQGMLTPGQGVQGAAGGMTAAGSGARLPANSTEAIRGAQRLAATPFIANALQGADPLSAPPTAFLPLLESTNNPQDSQALSQFLAYKMQADPQFQQIPLPERLAINAYVMGGPAAYRQARQAQKQQSVTAPVYGSQPVVPRSEARRIYGGPRTGSGISGF